MIEEQRFPFVGQSYTLANRKANLQSSVNLYLMKSEASAKSSATLESVDGLAEFVTFGMEVRGAIEVDERAFFVGGSQLYEIFSDGSGAARGTLLTDTGAVSMAYGLSQLVIVDGNGYVFTLATNAFVRISDDDFPGADTVDFIDNYFTFTKDRSGQQFQITAINDAFNIDALDFASAESSPDDLVGHLVVQAGVLLFGTLTCELWVNTGAADFPLERSRGSGFAVGLTARNSLREIDNGCIWIGRDKNGAGIVYRLVGGQPQRVSTQAIELALQASTDLTAAVAYTYQKNGLTFYAINAPGLKATWVYEVSTGAWHERCDIDVNGEFIASRGVCHVFALGEHLIGGSDGVVYRLDPTVYMNGADLLVRERTSPHLATPDLRRLFFSQFTLDCLTGGAGQGIDPQVELSWSDDSGGRWSNPILRSLGKVGERFARLIWARLGSGRDRVWRVRFSANAPFSIISATPVSKEGTN